MFGFRNSPFDEDIEKATHENNVSEDWSLIMHICDKTVNYQDGAKYCLKSIIKRLHHNVPRVVIQTLTLLDACVKNCDRQFLLQVASSEFTAEVRKLLAKMHPSAATKLKLLLQKWSLEEFKDDPELCIIPSLYYKLKSEGVEFPPMEKEEKVAAPLCTDPNAVSSQEEENDIIKAIEISLKDTGRYDIASETGISNHSTETAKCVEPFKVRALYDFDAAEDNELTIKTGEIVLVLDNSNSNWWKGSNHRGEGLFPANFVTEDLDFDPKIIVETTTEEEKPADIDVEVKIDEEKIEKVLNWLTDVDPTEEIPDPEDMLLLEKECYKMAPLIEENLQAVDNRLAMLNAVDEKISAAIELFHTLSNQDALKYSAGENYSNRTVHFPQPQISQPSATMYSNIQAVPSQMYIPAPSVIQYAKTVSDENNKSMFSAQTALLQSQMQTPQNCIPVSSVQVTETSHSIPTSDTSTKLSSNQNIPTSTVLNSSNPVGGYYMPSGMPYHMPLPNFQSQGYMPPGSTFPNFMPIPYPVPPVGPYFPYPYCYVNSTPSAQSTACTASVPFPQVSENSHASSNSAACSEETASCSALQAPNYSSDLQQLLMTSNANDQNEITSANANTKAAGDVKASEEVLKTEQM
ncbi:signal transducing adapter molecule 2-like isoform X2 [Stegodyphus dumicola]|uniref:signal transducing adapter molecule 2-like isoform X2 n=1 Tax=Stegodyphus dumicola TaxID=202533 RepID=UPI0015AF7E31|nr:signal transducing adapter molecule 2-like isoform X2 [Stegodyphus dumicola]